MIDNELLLPHVREHPHQLVFATISGAHLYGFESADSDFDLRGVHVLPVENFVGLDEGDRTIEKEGVYDGLEIDLVTHDAEKFIRLMLRPNGYVLEQVLSPLVVHTTADHERLKELATGCVTRHHAHHYLGFAASQWKKFLGTASAELPGAYRLKPLLYVYRVLLTGIYLMQTGRIEANLQVLAADRKMSFVTELIQQKRTGTEKGLLEDCSLDFHNRNYNDLHAELQTAHEQSHLREHSAVKGELNQLLVELRLRDLQAGL
ncbi:MAG: nucleotidyltransferase domain-containing protein [Pirellulaceae bacterium]